MKTIEYSDAIQQNSIPEYYKYFYPDSRLLFFDIETTGFAAKNTTLYLIGALWYENNCIRMIQWFNDNGSSEKEILAAFDTFCMDFTHLVHFNGLGFDLPYLRQKADISGIPFFADKKLSQIDILKKIRSYKKIFMLDNMKQVSIERYLGIQREDIYTGKELIPIYQQYLAKPDPQKEDTLLLHNHDDLLGLLRVSTILNYRTFFEQIEIFDLKLSVDKVLTVDFTYSHSAFLPKRISLSADKIYLNAFEQNAILQIPVIRDTLMHYFKDFKNYYYLPKEDMAIHKSIASYVDPDNRKKATKSTCYIKKADAFIPCYLLDSYDTFKFSITDKRNYQTLDSLLNAGCEKQAAYIQSILSALIHIF
ncbi:MAG: ribonuclease H-like domain-containing protein [Lachnospiraceae bacterium]|nr:ribonuclease H-like domain-containing protein [Lachnospiraceae bacterium]